VFSDTGTRLRDYNYCVERPQRIRHLWARWLVAFIFWAIAPPLLMWIVMRHDDRGRNHHSLGYNVAGDLIAAAVIATFLTVIAPRWDRAASPRRPSATKPNRPAEPPAVPPGRKHSE
jgi:hypothetical protein